MGKTFAEKVLARAAGLSEVTAGQVVDARPDVVLSHDNTAAIARTFRSLGVSRVKHPERLAITLDHAVPAPTTQHAQNHAEVRQFVAEQGITNFFEVGRGICHQVLSEEAIVLPGQLILGADSHTTHFGWMGAFGAGVGRSEVAALWATGELWLRVPESMRIVLEGELPLGVTSKDFALRIIGDLGADGGIYASIEFSGSGIEAMSIESRMVLPNMMAEMGAKNAYLAPDAAVFEWLAPRLARRTGRPLEECRAQIEAGALYPDPDARYIAEYHYDAGALEPYVACPHSVDRVAPLSQVAGTRVHQAFLGTCTNGRLEDLAAAAAVVKGRRVASGTRFLVIPASSEVLQEAMRLGYIQTLVEAGAIIGVPGCGPCMGNHMGIPAPGEVTISSANRNFQGRMGTREAEIYLASPAVVAASAIRGVITDPRELE
jgi:3-isopropylmalate/(R)-2-methylmalate dehydratase large subunit